MMEKKGTVTELSSLFPAEEAHKASARVQDAITERQQQLNQLKGFVDDNVSLINLVQKLPDETHHNIMVPFGKAAFFPGQLIHTNEFMVLLGEGYYAERTSKQTIDILKRRGKALETQVDSLKAIMKDLKAEASFFNATANESLEGLVEIREDYIEEGFSGTSPSAGYKNSDAIPPPEVNERKATAEDEEYARIFSRMDELEKEEEEAEKVNESDEEEEAEKANESDEEEEAEKANESDEEEEEAEKTNDSDEDEQIQNEPDGNIQQISANQEVITSPVKTLEVPAVSKDGASRGDYPAINNSVINKALEAPQQKDISDPFPASNTGLIGSIVERAHNIGVNLPDQQTRSSKPVSRFKMQRK